MSYQAPSDFAKIAQLEEKQNEIRDIVFFNSVHAVGQSSPFGQGRKNTALGSKLGSESWFPLESAITDINELLVSTGVFDKLDVQSIANVIVGPVGTLILKTIKNISDGKIFSVTPGVGRTVEITPGGGGGDDGKGIEVDSTLTLTDKDMVFMQYFKDADKVKIIAGSSIGGANVNLSNLVLTQINVGLTPDLDNTHHFGSVTNRWADAHVVIGIFSTVTVAVSLTATAAFFALGNSTLGDAITDSITVNGRFTTDLDPSASAVRDLGASGLIWDDLWIDQIIVRDRIRSDSATSEMGFFVKNETGTLGTLGTMQAPLLEQAALPTDATLDGFFGAFNGAFGFWRDTDSDPNSRGFVRMNGIWYHWFLTNL